MAGVSAEALRLRLADLAATGQGDLRALVGEFRRSEVLVPVVDGSLLSTRTGDVRWLFAFTDDAALERFAQARGEAVPDRVPVHGARLLDQVAPRTGGPTGIAVDAGSPAGMVLPPVTGIVPDGAVLGTGGTAPDAGGTAPDTGGTAPDAQGADAGARNAGIRGAGA
ncbi:SseB family protein [Streptomyces sp. HB2AG]|uniref:SseB family protein n=1 Tax=Streptomyces sp. HB2AG TaxID=2983400 RepID=UPI0022AAC73C|nr:SseB family protein [Streptomyces sp. HB2AG]MCZ2525351.1 SseB family protein [Streptomyces sp. HB2AG]